MVQRFSDVPGGVAVPKTEGKKILHIALPIDDQTILMASDVPSTNALTIGNNVYISIHTETKDEAKRLFDGLSAGGKIEMPIEDQFWGDYFGSFKDKFGVRWMVNCATDNNVKEE